MTGFSATLGGTICIVGVAYGPLLWQLFVDQWARPHYQYFPFVLGAFACLLWQRCLQAIPRDDAEPAAQRYASFGALVGALALLGFAVLVNRPWLAYLSFICLVTSAFLRVTSRWQVSYIWGIWLLLWLIRPLPLNLDQQLISFLQQQSSRLSSALLDFAAVSHLMEGNTLLLGEREFFVDEACSGIVSVMSIVACAVIYGVWRNRSPMHLILLAVAGVGWATTMNVLRISVIAMAYDWCGVDWSSGAAHEVLSLVVFLLTVLALVSTDYGIVVVLAPIKANYFALYGTSVLFGARLVDAWDWLQRLGHPASLTGNADESASVEAGPETATSNYRHSPEARIQTSNSRPEGGQVISETSVERRAGTVASRFVLGAVPLMVLGLLAGAQVVIPYLQSRQPLPTKFLEQALALDENSLPVSLGRVHQTSFSRQERRKDDVFGNYSRLYEYRDGRGRTYLVSCDFPFNGWHELSICYRGIGWELSDREVGGGAEGSGDAADNWEVVEADLRKPDGNFAFLSFCSFNEHGEYLVPPRFLLWDELHRSIRRRFSGAFSDKSFQIQVWTISPGQVDNEQKQIARDLLSDVRERLWRSIASTEDEIKE